MHAARTCRRLSYGDLRSGDASMETQARDDRNCFGVKQPAMRCADGFGNGGRDIEGSFAACAWYFHEPRRVQPRSSDNNDQHCGMMIGLTRS